MILRLAAVCLVVVPVASAQEPRPLWRKCGTEIAWMTDRRPLSDNNQGGGLSKTDVDLEDLWSDAKAKSRETGRPILWYIPKVQGKHMYRGAILDHYMNVAVWSDDAVIDLVNRRFVPLRAACVNELKDESGIGAFRVVEPAIAMFDASGKELHVLQRIRTFNADFIAAALRSALDKRAPAAPPDGASGEELLKGGWFEAAAGRLAGHPLRLAELRRREGRYDDALKLCDAAVLKGAAAAEVATVRGRALLSAGRIDEARTELKNATTPEGAYHLAHAERLSGHDDVATSIWARLAESSSDTRWGWRAQANVTLHKDRKAYGPAALGFEEVVGCAAPAAGATTTRWERTPADAADIARRAVGWLLRNQSAAGGWTDSRYAYWPSPAIQPNVHMAVTALACAALLEWRDVDPKRIDAALERGEKHLLDESKMARGQNEESYAEAYRLLYWSRKPDAARMNEIATRLEAIQQKDGFWAHEYPNPFVTATVLQVLLKAKRAGATVGDAVFSRGAAALKATRDDQGRQGYSAGRRGSTDASSSGRNAMCEAALLELKETERERFETAMAQFWTHLDRRENVRVCDYHSDGELAGFFFFNNFYHTMEAVPQLEGKARDLALARGVEHLAKIPEIDGSFIDSHEMGKSYGTACALLALKRGLGK